jgi:hypothetical protein
MVFLLIQYVHLKFDIIKMILHLNNWYLGSMQQDVLYDNVSTLEAIITRRNETFHASHLDNS